MPNDPFVDVAALSSLGPIRYLDARDQTMFDAGHAPGAVRVPVDEWDTAAKAADVGFESADKCAVPKRTEDCFPIIVVPTRC
jgi:thiosulfate/3-mercaptopyruvate sulfurtransferase